MGLRAELTGRILRVLGIELRRSRFTGDEAFFSGGREIAHFHGERALDIRLTRPRIRALAADLRGDPRVTLRGSSDWCEFAFRRRKDLDRAVELVALAVNG